jgi:hypothetical protein
MLFLSSDLAPSRGAEGLRIVILAPGVTIFGMDLGAQYGVRPFSPTSEKTRLVGGLSLSCRAPMSTANRFAARPTLATVPRPPCASGNWNLPWRLCAKVRPFWSLAQRRNAGESTGFLLFCPPVTTLPCLFQAYLLRAFPPSVAVLLATLRCTTPKRSLPESRS